jgi:hypothetical protein
LAQVIGRPEAAKLGAETRTKELKEPEKSDDHVETLKDHARHVEITEKKAAPLPEFFDEAVFN